MKTALLVPMLASATAAAPNSGAAASHATYHRVEVDGVGIFYREAGPPGAPVVVLLHGYPPSSRMYEPLIERLSGRYRLIAPDYPGCGNSDALPPEHYSYTFDYLAATMDSFLKVPKIDRYTLFLQDYARPVGFRLAMNNPDQVEAMIVQNANAYTEGLGAKWRGIAEYWMDRAAHGEQAKAFTSLQGARQRHIGSSPNPERYDPDSWTDEYVFLSRPGHLSRKCDEYGVIGGLNEPIRP